MSGSIVKKGDSNSFWFGKDNDIEQYKDGSNNISGAI